MCVLSEAANKSGLKRTRKGRDSSIISQRMSSLILSAKILARSPLNERQINQERSCGANCY
jgi:hypothetical protein